MNTQEPKSSCCGSHTYRDRHDGTRRCKKCLAPSQPVAKEEEQGEKVLTPSQIVMVIADKEAEIRKMGFASFFLEAIEKSIRKYADSQVEQLRVQLAGCIVAAEGNAVGENDAKEGDYGWSHAFNIVKDLRTSLDACHASTREANDAAHNTAISLAIAEVGKMEKEHQETCAYYNDCITDTDLHDVKSRLNSLKK